MHLTLYFGYCKGTIIKSSIKSPNSSLMCACLYSSICDIQKKSPSCTFQHYICVCVCVTVSYSYKKDIYYIF